MTDKQIIIDGDKFKKAENEPINQEAVNKFIKETDKFYVDGVDVSECDFLAKEDDYCSYSGVTYAYKGQCMFSDEEMCKEHPKCFYKKVLKQFKRKEQECEKAKQNAQDTYELYQALNESFNVLQGEKIKLEQECEQQKAELELFKTSNQTTIDQLKAENEALFKAIEEVNKINKRLEAENEELKIANLHIENNREHKANKLNRIEKLILACTTGYTDEFIQELLVILHEPEPVSFKNKYLQTLTEIKPILEFYANSTIGEKQEDGSYKLEFTFSDIATPYCINYDPKPAREALRKINEVEDAL